MAATKSRHRNQFGAVLDDFLSISFQYAADFAAGQSHRQGDSTLMWILSIWLPFDHRHLPSSHSIRWLLCHLDYERPMADFESLDSRMGGEVTEL
jgi:hypothetical protein